MERKCPTTGGESESTPEKRHAYTLREELAQHLVDHPEAAQHIVGVYKDRFAMVAGAQAYSEQKEYFVNRNVFMGVYGALAHKVYTELMRQTNEHLDKNGCLAPTTLPDLHGEVPELHGFDTLLKTQPYSDFINETVYRIKSAADLVLSELEPEFAHILHEVHKAHIMAWKKWTTVAEQAGLTLKKPYPYKADPEITTEGLVLEGAYDNVQTLMYPLVAMQRRHEANANRSGSAHGREMAAIAMMHSDMPERLAKTNAKTLFAAIKYFEYPRDGEDMFEGYEDVLTIENDRYDLRHKAVPRRQRQLGAYCPGQFMLKARSGDEGTVKEFFARRNRYVREVNGDWGASDPLVDGYSAVEVLTILGSLIAEETLFKESQPTSPESS